MSLQKADGSSAWDSEPVCNVQQTNNGIAAPACRSIQALFMTSIAMGRTVTFWFDYADTQTPSRTPTRFPS